MTGKPGKIVANPSRAPCSGLILIFFPVAGGIFSRAPTDLENVAPRPLLLMLPFTALQIVRDTTVDDLVADLKVVLVGISLISHGLAILLFVITLVQISHKRGRVDLVRFG